MTPTLEAVNNQIINFFRPEPVKCWINGRVFFIQQTDGGYGWRDEHGDMSEDFGLTPFQTAAEAQQSAITHVRAIEAEEAETARLDAQDREYGTYEEQHSRYYKDTRL